jgi:hypothetical protein
MEIRTLSPEDVKETATSRSGVRAIPIDKIDSTFKSQYTGTHLSSHSLTLLSHRHIYLSDIYLSDTHQQ